MFVSFESSPSAGPSALGITRRLPTLPVVASLVAEPVLI